MDIDLGKGIDGTEAAQERLRKRELPIVFLTGHAEKEYVEKVKKITGCAPCMSAIGSWKIIGWGEKIS